MDNQNIAFIGVALGWGAQQVQTESGPEIIQSTHFIDKLINSNPSIHWQATIYPEKISGNTEPIIRPADLTYDQRLELVTHTTQRLAKEVQIAFSNECFPIIVGGDHSMAIGTWSAMTVALEAKKKFGLIWFDAHMDSHTPQTSPSMAIHGMPLAALLGHGESSLVDIQEAGQKIDPKHLVLVGIRSYEDGEADFLKKLGVHIFYMKDIEERGFDTICQEALEIVNKQTKGFGLSIDLDGFDPQYAPGVGTPAPQGLNPQDVLSGLSTLINDTHCKALEIAEFNPTLDRQRKTIHLIEDIIRLKIK